MKNNDILLENLERALQTKIKEKEELITKIQNLTNIHTSEVFGKF
jgi:hypothetical protein